MRRRRWVAWIRNGAEPKRLLTDEAKREVVMPNVTDAQIREHAHKLWERAGKPEGRSEEFWHQAKSELEADEPGNELQTPQPMPE